MARAEAKNTLFVFDVAIEIGESYLYGIARGAYDSKNFAINIQGGGANNSTEIVLPSNLLADLPYVSKAQLCIRTVSEVINVDAVLSAGKDMIEIYDDDASLLLQKLVNVKRFVLEVIFDER